MLRHRIARGVFVDVEIGVGHQVQKLLHAGVIALHLRVEFGDALAVVLERRIGPVARLRLATLLLFAFRSTRSRRCQLRRRCSSGSRLGGLSGGLRLLFRTGLAALGARSHIPFGLIEEFVHRRGREVPPFSSCPDLNR